MGTFLDTTSVERGSFGMNAHDPTGIVQEQQEERTKAMNPTDPTRDQSNIKKKARTRAICTTYRVTGLPIRRW